MARAKSSGFLDKIIANMISSKNTYFLQRLSASSLPPLIEYAMNLVGESVIGQNPDLYFELTLVTQFPTDSEILSTLSVEAKGFLKAHWPSYVESFGKGVKMTEPYILKRVPAKHRATEASVKALVRKKEADAEMAAVMAGIDLGGFIVGSHIDESKAKTCAQALRNLAGALTACIPKWEAVQIQVNGEIDVLKSERDSYKSVTDESSAVKGVADILPVLQILADVGDSGKSMTEKEEATRARRKALQASDTMCPRSEYVRRESALAASQDLSAILSSAQGAKTMVSMAIKRYQPIMLRIINDKASLASRALELEQFPFGEFRATRDDIESLCRRMARGVFTTGSGTGSWRTTFNARLATIRAGRAARYDLEMARVGL